MPPAKRPPYAGYRIEKNTMATRLPLRQPPRRCSESIFWRRLIFNGFHTPSSALRHMRALMLLATYAYCQPHVYYATHFIRVISFTPPLYATPHATPLLYEIQMPPPYAATPPDTMLNKVYATYEGQH